MDRPRTAGDRCKPIGRWVVWLSSLVLLASGFALAEESPDDLADRAVALYDEERYREARDILEQLDADGLATGPLLYRLTFCLRVAGEREREQEVLARAVTTLEEEVLLATNLEPAFYLANAYHNLRRTDEIKRVAAAATARIEAGELKPDGDPLECFRAGKLYADQQNVRQASQWYQKALKGFSAEPGSQPAYVRWASQYLGDVAYSQGRFEDAAARYRAATDAKAANQGDWDRLAAALARLARWGEAEQAWQAAAKTNPADANRARYASRLAAAANKIGQLPDQDLSGTTWKAMSKEDLEAFLTAQSVRVKAIREQAATETDAESRETLRNEVSAIRAVFVAAALEYTLRNLPIRETAFFGGYAPLIFKDNAWELPEAVPGE